MDNPDKLATQSKKKIWRFLLFVHGEFYFKSDFDGVFYIYIP
jgi:hypothetical protein